MKKRLCAFTICVTYLLLFSGCTKHEDKLTPEETPEPNTSIKNSVSEIIADTTKMFSDRDYEVGYDESADIIITLEGNTATCGSDTVKISGAEVTISDGGTYILSGTLTDGTIIVNTEKTDKVHLVLNNVSVNSNTSAAIYIAQADKAFITLAPESVNTLSNGGEFTSADENIDAAVFSKDDLTLNGQGKLTVNSSAGHGIVSKDDLTVTGGNYTIASSGHGLCGKDSVRIASGVFDITSGKDGIHAQNDDNEASGFAYLSGGTYTITSEGDGIGVSGCIQIDNGSFNIFTGGGSKTVNKGSDGEWGWDRPGRQPNDNSTANSVSAKGIKSTGELLINKGTFSIDSADDALHSNKNLTVNDGTFKIATGDDGLHADELTTVAGGTINISKSYEGIEGRNINISGGVIDLVSSDDGLNAAGGNDQSSGFGGFGDKGGFGNASDSSVNISGGKMYVNALGDGIDSNGSVKVSGGETYISGPTNNGNGALDYQGEATVTGGIFVAAGSSGMAQNFGPSSTQGAMLVSVRSYSENGTIILTDSSGKNLISWTADKTFDCVVISCPEISKGKTYTVSVGESSQKVTMSELIYGQGGMGGGPGPGMGGGKRPRP